MLHNVYVALIAVDGFSPTSQVNSTGTAGNVIYLHLFMDALALQPCNPTCTFFIRFFTHLNRFIYEFFLLPSCDCSRCVDPG